MKPIALTAFAAACLALGSHSLLADSDYIEVPLDDYLIDDQASYDDRALSTIYSTDTTTTILRESSNGTAVISQSGPGNSAMIAQGGPGTSMATPHSYSWPLAANQINRMQGNIIMNVPVGTLTLAQPPVFVLPHN